VRLEGVRFRYDTGGDVLRDLTVTVAPSSRVAVVGETGSGKSTFVKLVTRLLDPTDGGGVRLRRPARPGALRRAPARVAFVPQDGFLFDTTIADNVRYGAPEASDDEVRTAFEQLGLTDWLDGLERGWTPRWGSAARGCRRASVS
jgi:ATP-binding cassette, subfamily B, bacterial